MWVIRVQIVLKVLERNGVSGFIFPIGFAILLQAVISQMHIVVCNSRVIAVTGGADVPFAIPKNILFVSHQRSNSDIKFSPFEEQRPLDVFLYDSVGVFRFVVEEVFNFFEGSTDFNAAPLVESCRLDESHIIFTVLRRHPFLVEKSSFDVFVSNFKRLELGVDYMSSD